MDYMCELRLGWRRGESVQNQNYRLGVFCIKLFIYYFAQSQQLTSSNIQICNKHSYSRRYASAIKMSKEVVLMAIDAGNSMDQMYNEESSRLKLAIDCINITLQQKVFNNSNHEVGLGIFGDNQCLQNRLHPDLYVLHAAQKPDLQLIRKLIIMSTVKLGNQMKGGDIFKALDACINEIERVSIKKKVKKRIFIFTNGEGDTQYDEYKVKRELATKIKACDVKVNVIAIGFMSGYLMDQNVIEARDESSTQINNAQLLTDLKAEAEEHVQIFPDELAIELYKKFRKREINPVALFKGEFMIAPELSVEVETYKLVRRERLKSLAKYDINAAFNPQITRNKEIVVVISYIIQGDQTNTEIEKQNQMNAYNYGPHLVPISDMLERDAKWHENRNFKLLGFVDESRVPRQALMGQVEKVVPVKGKDHLPGQKIFTALVRAMITLKRYAIARYVPRNSKNGVIPRLVVLVPNNDNSNLEDEEVSLYLVDLPTVQDVRDYPFNPLKESTSSQKQVVRQMIQKMRLYRDIDNQCSQQIKIENTFNPTRQYFFQSVFHRALTQQGQLPHLNKVIADYLTPEAAIFQKTQLLMKSLRKEFKLNRKELPKEKAAKKQQMLTWKQIVQDQMPTNDISLIQSESAGDQLKPHKMFPDDDDDKTFDPANPVESFKKMLNNNKVDLVKEALKQMTEYISAKLQGLTSSQQSKRDLINCVKELRNGCSEQQEAEFWDDWLNQAKTKLPQQLYKRLLYEDVKYLKKDNRLLTLPTQVFFREQESQLQQLD